MVFFTLSNSVKTACGQELTVMIVITAKMESHTRKNGNMFSAFICFLCSVNLFRKNHLQLVSAKKHHIKGCFDLVCDIHNVQGSTEQHHCRVSIQVYLGNVLEISLLPVAKGELIVIELSPRVNI